MDFLTKENASPLPSFQKTFVHNSEFSRNDPDFVKSEPDSDFEYDIASDCSSNISLPYPIYEDLFPLNPLSHADQISSLSSPNSFSSSSSTSSSSGSVSEDEGLDLSHQIKFPPVELEGCQGASKDQGSRIFEEQSSSKCNRIAKKKQKHPCPKCEKTFPSKSQLEEHFRYRHSDVRTFQCQLCPKVFKTKSNLNQHVRTHMGTTFRCEECDKSFTESGYRYHQLTHKSDKRFKCPECPKDFVQNKLLQKHFASCHSTERKYACPHCAARFKRKDHLNRHVTDTHSLVEKLFECEHCHVRFQSARRLRQHEKLHCRNKREGCNNNNQGPLVSCCEFCQKRFADESLLKVHLQKNHGQPDLLLDSKEILYTNCQQTQKCQKGHEQLEVDLESDLALDSYIDDILWSPDMMFETLLDYE